MFMQDPRRRGTPPVERACRRGSRRSWAPLRFLYVRTRAGAPEHVRPAEAIKVRGPVARGGGPRPAEHGRRGARRRQLARIAAETAPRAGFTVAHGHPAAATRPPTTAPTMKPSTNNAASKCVTHPGRSVSVRRFCKFSSSSRRRARGRLSLQCFHVRGPSGPTAGGNGGASCHANGSGSTGGGRRPGRAPRLRKSRT